MKNRLICLLGFLFLLCGSHTGLATLIYDEDISGDLSGDPLNPTDIQITGGVGTSYQISGTMGGPDVRDYFKITWPLAYALSNLSLVEYTDDSSGGDGNTGYIHIDNGEQSVIPSVATAGDVLGGSHLDRSAAPDANFNLLNYLSTAPQAGSGFSTPLLPSYYTFNVQQTGPQVTHYTLSFTLIPEPGSATLVLLGGCLLIRRMRQR